MADVTVSASEVLAVTVQAENIGSATYDVPGGAAPLELVVGDSVEDTASVVVPPDRVVEERLLWRNLTTGIYTVVVQTDDGSDSITVEVT